MKDTKELTTIGDKALAPYEGMRVESIEKGMALAVQIVKQGLAPKNDDAAAVFLKLTAGAQLGIGVSQALSQLTVVNGRVGMMGDVARALVEASGQCPSGISVSWEGEGDEYACVIRSTPAGRSPKETRFSVRDAKRARLWGKAGPWTDYPQRMLYYRPLGFHLRDNYGQILLGVGITEELQDIPRGHGLAIEAPGPDPLLGGATELPGVGITERLRVEMPEPERAEAPPVTGDGEASAAAARIAAIELGREILARAGGDQEAARQLLREITANPESKKPFPGFDSVAKISQSWQVEAAWKRLRAHPTFGDQPEPGSGG